MIEFNNYRLIWNWWIEKGTMIELNQRLHFHPDDFVPFVQKYFGSDIALDVANKIIHERINQIFNN